MRALLTFGAVANYSKSSMPVLRVDAHFTVVESALKGYVKWKSLQEEDETEVRQSLDRTKL